MFCEPGFPQCGCGLLCISSRYDTVETDTRVLFVWQFIKTTCLGFSGVFLSSNNIFKNIVCVPGVRAHADILRLVANLLVLQLMRVRRLEEGKLLLSLFRLDLDHSPPQPRYNGSPLSAPLYNTPSTLFNLESVREVHAIHVSVSLGIRVSMFCFCLVHFSMHVCLRMH